MAATIRAEDMALLVTAATSESVRSILPVHVPPNDRHRHLRRVRRPGKLSIIESPSFPAAVTSSLNACVSPDALPPDIVPTTPITSPILIADHGLRAATASPIPVVHNICPQSGQRRPYRVHCYELSQLSTPFVR